MTIINSVKVLIFFSFTIHFRWIGCSSLMYNISHKKSRIEFDSYSVPLSLRSLLIFLLTWFSISVLNVLNMSNASHLLRIIVFLIISFISTLPISIALVVRGSHNTLSDHQQPCILWIYHNHSRHGEKHQCLPTNHLIHQKVNLSNHSR